jgi:hypothetical protein
MTVRCREASNQVQEQSLRSDADERHSRHHRRVIIAGSVPQLTSRASLGAWRSTSEACALTTRPDVASFRNGTETIVVDRPFRTQLNECRASGSAMRRATHILPG